MIYILMGVSGAGKSFIGQKLAESMDLPFYDGDDFHPVANVKKMRSGQPLSDEDRRPWLHILKRKITKWNGKGDAVLACSALKKSYREVLNPPHAAVQFIYLKGSRSLIADRLKKRSNHFMSESLLASQFEALEEPRHAITIKINQSPPKIVEEIGKQI